MKIHKEDLAGCSVCIVLLAAFLFLTGTFGSISVENETKPKATGLNISLVLIEFETPIVYNNGKYYEVQNLDCCDDTNQGAGQMIITSPDGQKYLVFWEDMPPGGFVDRTCPEGYKCDTGTNPQGLVRVYHTAKTFLTCADIQSQSRVRTYNQRAKHRLTKY